MANWNFLKKPKFWITTIITIILTFIGGFFIGQSIVINGDFTDLQNDYNLLNSSYNKLIVQNSQGIFTQNQQGDNVLITPEKPPRKLDVNLKNQIDVMLSTYEGKKILLNYLNGDTEAFDFANKINNYLTQKGYNVEGSSIITSGKMTGQKMFNDDNRILTFSIGSQI